MTSAHPRPGLVDAAFWCWMAAAGVLILGGLLAVITTSDNFREATPGVSEEQIRSILILYRGSGAICVALGLAFGYTAWRTRRGDKRFRRATIALSVATVVLLVVFAILLGYLPYLAPLSAIGLIVAPVLATRHKASAWFDAVDSGSDGG
jgi:uncharacterized membrane protein